MFHCELPAAVQDLSDFILLVRTRTLKFYSWSEMAVVFLVRGPEELH